MIARKPVTFRPLRVLFCECGQWGGSPRQLHILLKNLNRQIVQPGVLTYYSDHAAAALFDLPDLFCRFKIPVAPAGVPDILKRVGRCWVPTPFGLQYLLCAWYVLLRSRPDVVYLNNLPAQHLPVILIARRLGIPIVCHLRATRPVSALDRLGVPYIDRFIALSKAGKRHYAAEGLERDLITVVYNALDLASFDVVCAGVPKHVLPAGPFYVTQVGTLDANKRPRLALEALDLVRSTCPKMNLVLVGHGRLTARVRQEVQVRGLEDRVLLLGNRTDVAAILRDSHVGLLLSQREGLGNVVLEYMAAGLPVVVTEIAAVDEMVDRDRTALVLSDATAQSVASALRRLYCDAGLRTAMGVAGRRMVEESSFVRQNPAHAVGTLIREMIEW